ncbi:extracellular solute-binding protein [Paenibacillus alkaliterrae]|uniref:extracellular solute-binding protein n=1 Tax=Paenibacillus alkaliterrae TaxID=320909 RepID=UPI001F2D201E|nr:extracellular solute-binding protein [Paenibacillus alkaliterrae]MCF2941825.1 extracellular solute-binding protein [Paenibacillus alkaliterrae]
MASTGVFARSGMLEELTAYAERDKDQVQLDDFNPGLMGNACVDDKLFGLPFMRSTPILYKNVTMLKDAGLDPEGPKTWDELEQYSRVLKEKGKVGMTVAADIWFYEALVAQSGCQLVMTSKSTKEEKEAAWEFITWMTSKENTTYQHKHVGYLPTRMSAVESDELKAHFAEYPQFKVAVDQLEYARPRPMENAYPEVAKIVKDAIQKAIIEPDTSPQEALNEAAEKANKLLGK